LSRLLVSFAISPSDLIFDSMERIILVTFLRSKNRTIWYFVEFFLIFSFSCTSTLPCFASSSLATNSGVLPNFLIARSISRIFFRFDGISTDYAEDGQRCGFGGRGCACAKQVVLPKMSFGRNGDGWCAREPTQGLERAIFCNRVRTDSEKKKKIQSYNMTFSTSSKLLQQFKICKAVRGRAFNSHENPGIGKTPNL
jgi:hypothetical protein